MLGPHKLLGAPTGLPGATQSSRVDSSTGGATGAGAAQMGQHADAPAGEAAQGGVVVRRTITATTTVNAADLSATQYSTAPVPRTTSAHGAMSGLGGSVSGSAVVTRKDTSEEGASAAGQGSLWSRMWRGFVQSCSAYKVCVPLCSWALVTCIARVWYSNTYHTAKLPDVGMLCACVCVCVRALLTRVCWMYARVHTGACLA